MRRALARTRRIPASSPVRTMSVRAAAGDFEHAGYEAVRVVVWPVVDGPDGEGTTFGRVALSRQNVENRIVAHWSVVSISARRRMASQ